MRIHIVGWSGVNHSYSVIAEDYVRGLMLYPENNFYFTPHKYYVDKWKKYRRTIFDEMECASEFDKFDVTINFTYPYDFTPDVRSKITIVFVTCEFNYISDFVDTNDICSNVFILTPSNYSKKGIVATGIKSEKIIVISHSYDYVDGNNTVEQLRRKYNIPDSNYVFYHNSSLTPNKNFISILMCFEKVYNINPNTTLLVKGNDGAYGSKDKLVEMIQTIKMRSELKCEGNIVYVGNDLSANEMSELYEISDCYVSPFFAEGFNLPVLEALCHGKKIICTRGGPPDEYATDGIFISSKEISTKSQINVNGNMKDKVCLFPSENDLLNKMLLVMYSNKIIDKQFYKSKYSYRKIGVELNEKISNLLDCTYAEPEIMVILNDDIEKTRKNIENIRLFCGNVNILIGYEGKNEGKIEHMMRHVKKYEYLEFLKVNGENTLQQIKSISEKKCGKDIVYIGCDAIMLVDPRNFYSKYDGKKVNKIFYGENDDDKIVVACIGENNIGNTREQLLTTQTILNKKYKWVDKRNNIRILYLFDDDDKIFRKVYAIENTTNEDIEKFLITEVDNKITPKKFLEKVNVAIMTSDVYEKYKNIFRNAPLTIMFEKNRGVKIEECADLNKGNIFVYPESLTYFFSNVYKFVRNKFNLYTFECDFAMKGSYKLFDKDFKILKFDYIRNVDLLQNK